MEYFEQYSAIIYTTHKNILFDSNRILLVSLKYLRLIRHLYD